MWPFDLERNFGEMAKLHDEALRIAREKDVTQKSNGHDQSQQEIDDLTEIVGVGKVFQNTLHNLGIFSFRQIAAFGVSDIARVNMSASACQRRVEALVDNGVIENFTVNLNESALGNHVKAFVSVNVDRQNTPKKAMPKLP